jgi:hypothetical protein
MSETKPISSTWSTAKPFFNGGLSGMMATCIIQPIDMVKVRLQLGASGSPFKVAADIIKSDGALRAFKIILYSIFLFAAWPWSLCETKSG